MRDAARLAAWIRWTASGRLTPIILIVLYNGMNIIGALVFGWPVGNILALFFIEACIHALLATALFGLELRRGHRPIDFDR